MTKTNYTFEDSDEASLRLRNLANIYEPDTRSLLKRSEVHRLANHTGDRRIAWR